MDHKSLNLKDKAVKKYGIKNNNRKKNVFQSINKITIQLGLITIIRIKKKLMRI
jgi:hypothetical protein